MRAFRQLVVVSVVFLASAGVSQLAVGQATDADEALAALRKKAQPLTDAERKLVGDKVAEDLARLEEAVAKPTTKDYTAGVKAKRVAKSRAQMVRIAEGSTPAFREVYLGLLGQRVVERLGRSGTDIELKVNLASLLAELADPVLMDSYIKALTNSERAVKYAALKGLLAIREKVDEAALGRLCGQIVQFIAANNDRVLLEQAYRIIDYPTSAACRAALIKILSDRAASYDAGEFASLRADHVLVRAAGVAYSAAPGPQQKQILAALARILKGAARYGVGGNSGNTVRRVRTLLVVYTAEGVLAGVTKQQANRPVTAALAGGDAKAVESALASWLGNGQQKGVLNNPPYNLPPLAGRPASRPAGGG